MRYISKHNSFGQIETFPIVTEFTDPDGFVFFVYGPCPVGLYAVEPPYRIARKGEGEWVSK